MNPILFKLGPIEIYWYSIMILLAILIGGMGLFKNSKKEGYDKEFVTDLIFYSIIFGILGARIYYIIFNLGYYLHNPLEIVAIWNGGLAIHGGIIGGLITIVYMCKKHKKSILKTTDLVAPSLILAQAIGRWGNFFNGEAHGPEVTKNVLQNLHIPRFVINGMNIDGKYYHPTFFYESVWNFLGFILLGVLKRNLKLKKGQLTGVYFMWYSFARFFIEGLRTDSLMFLNLKVARIISVLLFLLGTYLVFHKKKDTRMNRLKERSENNE